MRSHEMWHKENKKVWTYKLDKTQDLGLLLNKFYNQVKLWCFVLKHKPKTMFIGYIK